MLAHSQRFIDWLTEKLDEHGVEKVVPEEDDLREAYIRAVHGHALQRAIDKTIEDFKQTTNDVVMPEDFPEELRERLNGSEQPWDELLWGMTIACVR